MGLSERLDTKTDIEDYIRKEIAGAFYDALVVEWKGQQVDVMFESKHPIAIPVMTGPSFVKDIEPTMIDVRKLVAATLPGLWGYIDAELGPRQGESCLRCGKIFEMNEKRKRLEENAK